MVVGEKDSGNKSESFFSGLKMIKCVLFHDDFESNEADKNQLIFRCLECGHTYIEDWCGGDSANKDEKC